MISQNRSEETALTCKDNTMLYLKSNTPLEYKGVVIIVHGVCEHSGRYDYLTSCLNKSEYAVIRFDLRGHGKSGGRKGDVSNFLDFSEDLQEVVIYAKRLFEKIPIYILGHSMGAFISACYGVLYPDEINGQILSGIPAIVLPLKEIKLLKKLPVKLIPNFKSKNSLGEMVSKDPKVVLDYKQDPLNLTKTTINMSNEMFIKGPAFLQENIKKYRLPVLLLHGEDDKIVTKDSSEWFFNNIKSKNKKRIVYEGLYHEIYNEPERDKVIEDTLQWLDAELE